MSKIFKGVRKHLKEILTSIGIIVGIIISFLLGWKLEKNKKNSNWRKIKNKKDTIKIKDKDGNWKEIKLPKNKDGKQIKSNDVETIHMTEGGKINVTIKKGATDRRNVSSLDDDVFTSLDL